MILRWFKSRKRARGAGLALSGGGAHGAAHVGVLRALQEQGQEISCLAGTSAGAFFAVLRAFEHPLEEIEAIAKDVSWRDISGIKLGRRGLMSNAKMGKLIEEALGEVRLEDARIPVAVVTTDLADGSRYVIREGDAAMAVTASTCVPGIFHPIEHEHRVLVDGGLVENLPLKTLSELGADYLIGVDLGDARRYKAPEHIFDVIGSAVDIAIHNSRQPGYDLADLMIKPDLSEFSRTDTKRTAEIIEAGHAAAIGALGAS